MIAIEQTENQIIEQESRASHVLALIEALAPDPSQWEYRGECDDAGAGSEAKCACGHPIRFLFPIYHADGRVKIVGSTCVNHFASINPATGQLMLDKLDELNAKLAEQKKAAKRAADDAENARLWSEYCAARDAAVAAHNANRAEYRRSPYQLWYFAAANREEYRRQYPPEYTRACDLKRWLTKAIARAKSAMTATA